MRRPDKYLYGLLTVPAMIFALRATGVAAEGDARALVQRVLNAVPKKSFTAAMTLTSDRGWVRELQLSHKDLKGVDAAYMEVTSPLDLKDTRFLLLDRPTGRDEQFIYVPAMKRTIQVNSETQKQPFLGSDFYVYDMVRPDFDAFTYSFVGDADVNGRHCKLVQSVPKDLTDALYSKTVTAIDPVDLVVLRTQFFDPQGKLLKVWTIEKLEKIEGVWTPMEQKMVNVQTNHWSKIQLTNVKYNADLPDSMFSRSYLAH